MNVSTQAYENDKKEAVVNLILILIQILFLMLMSIYIHS